MIGQKLKAVRTANRWTNKLLAEKSGVNKTTISKIESGHMSPTVDTLEKLASAMGFGISVFFADEVEYKQPEAM